MAISTTNINNNNIAAQTTSLPMTELADQVATSATKVYQTVTKKYLGIQECTCQDFDRKVVTSRSDLERTIVDEIKKAYPNKDEKIRLCSVGSGGCFQEAVILSKLIREGYTNIELVLTDESYESSSSYFYQGSCTGGLISVAALKEFVKVELRAEDKITIKTEGKAEKYLQTITDPKMAPHVFILTDLQSTEFKVTDEFNQTYTSDLFSVSMKSIKKNTAINGKTLCAFTHKGTYGGTAACISLENHDLFMSKNFMHPIVTDTNLVPLMQKKNVVKISIRKTDNSGSEKA